MLSYDWSGLCLSVVKFRFGVLLRRVMPAGAGEPVVCKATCDCQRLALRRYEDNEPVLL